MQHLENVCRLSRLLAFAPLLLSGLAQAADTTVTFDDNSLPPNSYWNGSDGSGGFTSNGFRFPNSYTDFGGGYYGWEGWSYSNGTNTTQSAYASDGGDPPTWTFYADRQYSAITGGGAQSSPNYAVAYQGFDPLIISMPQATKVTGMYVTNTTYDYLAMLDGNPFAKKFGGTSGNDPDWFKLSITGLDSNGQATGSTDFYLADFRSSNKYIVNGWNWIDLSGLGKNVRTLEFNLSSTDNGNFGMNTPAYFAVNNFTYAAPAAWSGSSAGTWSNPANWGGTALAASQAIAFGGTSPTVTTNDIAPGTVFSSLAFETSAAAFTLSGNSIQLAGDLTNSSTSEQTVNMNVGFVPGGGAMETDGGDIRIAGNITGSSPLTKSGSATLILSGTNSYTGGTVVADGTLEIVGRNALLDGSALSVGSETAAFGSLAPPVEPAEASTAVPEPGVLPLLTAAGFAAFVLRRGWVHVSFCKSKCSGGGAAVVGTPRTVGKVTCEAVIVAQGRGAGFGESPRLRWDRSRTFPSLSPDS